MNESIVAQFPHLELPVVNLIDHFITHILVNLKMVDQLLELAVGPLLFGSTLEDQTVVSHSFILFDLGKFKLVVIGP